MPRLEELLDEVAPTSVVELDYDALAQRGASRRRVRRGVVAASILAVVGMTAVPFLSSDRPIEIASVVPESSGPWQDMAPAPIGPRTGVSTSVDGTRLLLWGGQEPSFEGRGETILHMVDGAVYDVDADTWVPVPAPPWDMGTWPSAFLVDDTVVVLDRTGTTRPAIHDLRTGTWRQGNMAPASLSDADVFTRGDHLLLRREDGDVLILDISSGAWTHLASPGFSHWPGVEVGERHLFVVGGSHTEARPREDHDLHMDGWLLDLDTGTWSRVAPAPVAGRTSPGVQWVDGRFLVWGGSGPDQDGWEGEVTSSEGEIEESCEGDRCSAGMSGTISITPGAPPIERTDGAWYDPVSDTWELIDPLAMLDVDGATTAWHMSDARFWMSVEEDGVTRAVLLDVVTGEQWDVRAPGTNLSFEISGGSILARPYVGLLRPGQAGHEWELDAVMLREVRPGLLQERRFQVPEAWSDMNVAVVDGRIVVWSGVQELDFERTESGWFRSAPTRTWLDGGWVIDLRNPAG